MLFDGVEQNPHARGHCSSMYSEGVPGSVSHIPELAKSSQVGIKSAHAILFVNLRGSTSIILASTFFATVGVGILTKVATMSDKNIELMLRCIVLSQTVYSVWGCCRTVSHSWILNLVGTHTRFQISDGCPEWNSYLESPSGQI